MILLNQNPPKMKRITTFFILTLVAVGLSGSMAPASDYRMQSVFLYNFTRLIAWPGDYQSGDFVISVYGDSPMYAEVEKMAQTKKAGKQSIIAKKVTSVNEIGKCHIIYIPSSNSGKIESVATHLKQNGIKALIVTESRNATDKGSVINFTIVNNRQRFELSESNAKAMGLNPGGEIQRLAILAD